MAGEGLRFVLGVSESIARDLTELQRLVRATAELTASQNSYLIRKLGRKRIPRLYDSGVVYRFDPKEWDPRLLYFPTCEEIIARRWVDCKGAVPFLLADLRLENPAGNYGVHTYPRQVPGVGVLIHLQLSMPDGQIEDPSRLLHQ